MESGEKTKKTKCSAPTVYQNSSGRINKASFIVFVIVGLYDILRFPYGIKLLMFVISDGGVDL